MSDDVYLLWLYDHTDDDWLKEEVEILTSSGYEKLEAVRKVIQEQMDIESVPILLWIVKGYIVRGARHKEIHTEVYADNVFDAVGKAEAGLILSLGELFVLEEVYLK